MLLGIALGRSLQRAARSITRRPAIWLLGGLLLAGIAANLTRGLQFHSSYLALLPEGAPEVQELIEAQRHTGGTSELVIAIGGDPERRLAYARRAVAKLRQSPWVQWAQLELPVEFLEQRRLLLLSLEQLREIHQTVKEAVSREKARANPLFVDLEDEETREAKDPLHALKQLEQRYAAPMEGIKRLHQSRDGQYLFLMVKPRTASSQLDQGRGALAQLQQVMEEARLPGDDLPVRYAGSLVNNQMENQRMSRDLALASVLALVLTVALITAATRKWLASLIVGLPLVAGLLTTLAFATLTVGHLNLVSGFLVAALVGLGIDFGVHLYLAFLDELAQQEGSGGGANKAEASEAMQRAMGKTFGACLTSAATTSVAFLALSLSSFRGFSEYGLIAGGGVLLTFGVTFVTLPPLALLLTRQGRARPGIALSTPALSGRLRNLRPLSRGLAWAMLAAGLGFALFSAWNLDQVRFYNNFRALKGRAPEQAFGEYVEQELGSSLSPAALMVDGFEQLRRAVEVIRLRRDKQGRPLISRMVSLSDLVPQQVAEKQAVLDGLRKELETLLIRVKSPADAHKVRRLMRLCDARPWTSEEVPDAFRRRLVGMAGSGSVHKHLLLLWPAEHLVDDGAIARWAVELHKVRAELANAGITPLLLDENLIAARVLQIIRAEGPRVLALSGLAVLLVLLLDFRRLDRLALVGGSVALGLVGMLGTMVLFDLQINLFNAVVLPTVLGVGIDNAVHIQHAYARLGRGSVPRVVATSGRAALLSSATTGIGFGAAITAHHLGIQQMGLLAVLGIGCTFAATTVIFPAALRVLEGRGLLKYGPSLSSD